MLCVLKRYNIVITTHVVCIINYFITLSCHLQLTPTPDHPITRGASKSGDLSISGHDTVR